MDNRKMEIGKLIRRARLSAGYGLTTVASLTGVPASVQSKIELGDIASPSFLYIARLAKFYHLDMEGLYDATLTNADTTATMAKAIKSKLIPVISWVQAGSWHESLNCNHEGEVITSPYRCSDEAFALEVRGDSMTAQTGSKFSFPEGSRIIVEPNAEARHRSFVVARINGTDEATFKRLNIEGDHYLQPLNPQYPIMPVNSNIHICGVVVGMIQKIPF